MKRRIEQNVQEPADPEVFLQDDRREASAARRFLDVELAVFRRKLQKVQLHRPVLRELAQVLMHPDRRQLDVLDERAPLDGR